MMKIKKVESLFFLIQFTIEVSINLKISTTSDVVSPSPTWFYSLKLGILGILAGGGGGGG